jgi:hypothetical protein
LSRRPGTGSSSAARSAISDAPSHRSHRRRSPTVPLGSPTSLRVEPLATDPDLPVRLDVVVIGSGIAGASTAFFLAQKGVSVALCQQGDIAGEQSSRNWGFCRQQGRYPRKLPLIVESLRIWRSIDRTIEGNTGFRQAGIVHLAKEDKAAAAREKWLDSRAPISGSRE